MDDRWKAALTGDFTSFIRNPLDDALIHNDHIRRRDEEFLREKYEREQREYNERITERAEIELADQLLIDADEDIYYLLS